jgi:hypothetical protein
VKVFEFFSYILVRSVEAFSQALLNPYFRFFLAFASVGFCVKSHIFRRVGLHWKAKQKLLSFFGKLITKSIIT